MYAVTNFKSKKALREAVAAHPVACYQPGPFGSEVPDGWDTCEGPHYPKPHRWYARVRIEDGMIVEVKK